ncbi:hypothetical protein ACFQT0_24040 [Hymenobacter humi]|uniref:Uncharacterized protein n=1 Tax=Hymenobacter humi TaxID=1411620 RepID=A0ABW2U9S7_9BACT
MTQQRDRVINSSRTGAETSVSREQINRLPTLSRSLTDFTRLTPQAGGAGARRSVVLTTATTTSPSTAR